MAYDPSRASPTVKEPKAQSDITLDALLDEFEVSDPAVRDRVLRLAGVESSGNLNATGPRVNGGMHNGTRARGALQIMPATAKAYPQYDLNDPADASRAGLHYFLDNLNQFGGDLDAATIAHHAGPGTAKKWLREGRAGTVDRATGLSTDDYLLKVSGGKRAKPADKWWEGDPVAPAEAAGNWWESDPVEPAEEPGLLERGWSALKGTLSAPSGEPVDVRPHPGEKAPAAAKPDSVMADYPGEQSARQTPANAQTRAFVQQQYDAHPEKREAMLSRPDWLGDIARQVDAEYQAMNPAESLKPFDQRREAKLERNRAQGMDPATAEMTTASQMIGGEAPVGSIKASDFDFDLKQRYEGANPALRGAVKGYEGYRQGILGFLQAGADFVGADFASGQFKQGARKAAGQVAAIGEGEAGARLFEGAVASLTQQLPLLIGGSIAGGQALILGGMAAQAFGQEYSEGRQAGLDGQDAATRASLFAAFEVIGEKFGLGNQLAALRMAYKGVPTKQLVAELGAALAKEIPGEVLTTTGQFLTDKAPQIGLNPEAGMAQYLSQVADTIGQTIIQGGLMMGGASAVSRGARAMQRPEPDLTAGLQFDPGVNDALARQALDPSNAQETADVAPPLDAASYQGPSADPAGSAGNTPSGPVGLGRVDQPAGAPARSGEPGVSVGEAERQQVAGVVEQKIAEKEAEAAATGDPIEMLVTRAEGAAMRRAVTPQPANGIDIDQDALLADVEAMFTEGGNLMVQGDNAREAVKRIDPKALASALPRGDGALLVPKRFAGPVMDALQGAKQRVSVAFGGDGMMQAPDVAQFRATVPTQEEVQDVPKAEQVDGKAQEAGGQEGAATGEGTGIGAVAEAAADTEAAPFFVLAPTRNNERVEMPVWSMDEARQKVREYIKRTGMTADQFGAGVQVFDAETGQPAARVNFDGEVVPTETMEQARARSEEAVAQRGGKQPTQAPMAPEQSRPAQAKAADKPKRQPPARKPDPVTVDRAQRNAEDLRAMAQDAGWAEEGGKLIRDAAGNASRTKWIPRAEWFMTGMEARPDVLAQHIEAAARGEWIPVKSARTIEGMVEWLDAQRGQATLDEDASMYDFEASFGDVLDAPDAREVAEFFDDAFGGFAEQSEADAMRALGFTEEEIANAVGQTQAGAGSAETADARGTAAPGERAGEAGAAQEEAGQGQREGLTLDAYTNADIAQREAEQTARAEADARAEREAAAKQRQAEERAEVRRRSEAAADTYELGMDPMENLTGQGGIFGQADPAPQPARPAAPAASVNTIFTEDAAEKARALLRRKLGQLNSGVDPEMLQAGITLAGYHIEKGARTFAAYARAMLGDLGESVRPYLKSWYVAIAFDPRARGFEGMDNIADVQAADENADFTGMAQKEQGNGTDERGDSGVEPDRRDAATQDGVGEEGIRAEPGRDAAGRGQGVQGTRADSGARRSGELSGREAAPARERGDLTVYTGATDVPGSATRSDLDRRSADPGIDGAPVEPDAAKTIEAAARGGSRLAATNAAQAEADATPHGNSLEDIRAALPALLPGQQEDVFKAEQRFAKPDGYGMLFTNGTGTGKTFTGLGIVKRFALAGKTNTLIVAPNDKIIEDWQKSGRVLGLDIARLQDTNDAGAGIVITTYANFGDNAALASREWDMVVSDESHYLMQDKDGTPTSYLRALRAITLHPDGVYRRHEMLNGDEIAERNRLSADAKMLRTSDDERQWAQAEKVQDKADALSRKLDEKFRALEADIKARQGASRTRAVFLSATPFAYEKTIDWANGYLFDYNEGQPSEGGSFRGYNDGGNRERFFMQHLGYRMRHNKLTEPDAKVDSGLMQRQFNGWLKKKGSLSGRMLDVPFDYDRRFILVDSAIGTRIDAALTWLREEGGRIAEAGGDRRGVDALKFAIDEKFDYLSRRYLLEAIKAAEVIPHVREHLALGRKVVVYHDYKKGGGFNPFVQRRLNEVGDDADAAAARKAYNAALDAFNQQFADLIGSDIAKMPNPIEAFQRAFPDVLLFNGNVPKQQRRASVAKFQDDASGPQVILVQSAAGKEGISLHDTTGKYQRVLFNLGQPTQPTTAIQQEGRIYRTGQQSDAIIRYLNTGTNWEKWAFASTIAQRASAAENLGAGEQARALKDAFIQGFEESNAYRAGMEGEGKGGKERDRLANEAISEYDRAKAYYFGQQKKTSKTKAQEGADYFATPEPVGLKMVEWADIRPGERVLEPSAGHGAIARWMPENAERTAIEPSSTLLPRLAMVFDGKIQDTTFEALNVVNKFDAIVMNPPFGSGGKTAIEHVAKAATHLRERGRIVALIPTGPAADKRFEKWFYETEERPAKPLFEHPTLGPIYRGDTLTISGFGASTTIVVDKVDGRADGPRYVRDANTGPAGAINATAISKVEAAGQRMQAVRPAEGLHLIADIKMPGVTFERAGTRVATRIVVIEKQSDPAVAQNLAERQRDYTGVDDIGELFDRLEDLTLPKRAGVVEADAAPAGRAEQASDRPKPKAANPDAVGTVERQGLPIVEHTTAKGKVIRGVIRTDLSKEQAQKIDPYTWKKDGGFFIREQYLKPEGDAPAMSRAGGQEVATAMTRSALVQSISSRFPSLTRAVESALRRGDEGKPGGVVVVERAEDLAGTFASKTGRSMDDAVQSLGSTDGRDVNGLFDSRSGLTFLVAPNLTERTAPAVLLHEATHGKQRAEIDRKAMDLIETRQARSKPLRDFLFRVEQRMDAAGESGNVTEAAAYIVEEAVVAGRQAGFSAVDGKLMNWIDLKFGRRVSDIVRDFVAMVRAWAMRAGVDLNPTVDDLVAIAKLNVRDMARGDVTGGEGAKESRVSQTAQAAPRAAQAQATPPDETRFQAFQRKAQDKLNRFTVIKEWLAAQGVTLSEQADVYKAEERMHSRFANKAEDFREKTVKPLVEKIQRAGYSMDDVAQYLHAQHAEERNIQVASINKQMPDGGSGMKTADATAILAAAPAELKRLANEFRAITERTKQILLDNGIISQDMADAWDATYQHYVPLKGGPEQGGKGAGKGLKANYKGRRALGHTLREEGEWIVENILADHERAIMLAEKNRIGQSLLKMAIEVGRDDLLTVGRPEKRGVLKSNTAYEVLFKGRVVGSFQSLEAAKTFRASAPAAMRNASPSEFGIRKVSDPTVAYMASPMLAENEVNVYVRGQAIRVQINDELLARAYGNMGTEALGAILRVGATINGYFSKIYTGYNPEFILTNIVRDFTTGVANVTGEEGAMMALRAAKDYPASFADLFRYATTGNASQWIRMYREDGGNTGAAYLSDLERLGDEISTEYAAYKGVLASLKAGDVKSAARAAGRKAFDKTLVWVERINQAGENAMRLAIYKAMIESGKSRAEAASLAKNATVNFNRKGEVGGQMNALWLFYNAGVQGTAAIAHANLKGRHKWQVRAVSAGILGLGYTMAVALGAGDDEDDYDKLSDYTKARNVVIKTGDGWLKIPVPYGYGFLWNMGRAIADAERKGEWGKAPWHVASSFIEEFTPFGAAFAGDDLALEQVTLGALPTLAQIPASVGMNRTTMGVPMYPESAFDKYQPDNEKMWRATKGTIPDMIAQALDQGGIEVSPETIKYLTRTFTGGAGQFVTSIGDAAWLTANGASLEVKEQPFVRKFYTETDVREARSAYHAAVAEAEKAVREGKSILKMGDHAAYGAYRVENQEFYALDRMAKAQAAAIKARRNYADAIRADKSLSVKEKRDRLKAAEAQEQVIYDRYLEVFKSRARH